VTLSFSNISVESKRDLFGECIPDSILQTTTEVYLNDVCGVARLGTVTAVIGPAGSGKSALLRALSRRQSSEEKGVEITLNGNKDVNLHLYKRYVSYLSQNPCLIPNMTVREYLTVSASMILPLHERRGVRVKEVMDELMLSEVGEILIGESRDRTLSEGERARVSIAEALLSSPPVLLLDEPASTLDPSAACTLGNVLQNYARTHGTTVVLSVNRPPQAMMDKFDNFLLLAPGGHEV
tara:strand:+ start:2799 stop:3512 length:714 start_codon:yes stop_codon:yes gene_type:complete